MPSDVRRTEREIDQSSEQIQSLITNLRNVERSVELLLNEKQKVDKAIETIYESRNIIKINSRTKKQPKQSKNSSVERSTR